MLGVGNGAQTVFQTMKTYNSGSTSEQRVVKKLVSGTVKIYFGDTLQSASLYTIDHAAGTITFISPPALATQVKADFEFDVPVRFDTDRLSATLDDYGVHSWHDIPLVEVRL